ncbi:amino acid permease, putative [Trypanosoma cruzi marinkellei]|uniref:Amino acid permease, putative n=1 Tax=Trypanosoma cruzi marinkellei TaxID=85056 RepID=K2MR11_TRYCR|nr:amino acid permease, putative [Trypanosoma cruzi marinkellei]
MTDDSASTVPLLNPDEKVMAYGFRGFEISRRPYQAETPEGCVSKQRWGSAPRGAVVYLKPRSGASQDVLVSSPRGSLLLYSKREVGSEKETKVNEDIPGFPRAKKPLLGQLRATAIAGNEIASSCIYAIGIVVSAAGRFACFSSLLVSVVLYLFRWVYTEMFGAQSTNGGTYNALRKAFDKNWASLAAILSTLSYVATAVTSAASAADYLQFQWNAMPSKSISLGILVFFAVVNLFGMRESSYAASIIFLFHLLILCVLVLSALVYVCRDGGKVFHESWNSPSLAANPHDQWITCIFFGYSSALLGATGFESSSNYIEEQGEGVYPKTLRNMWFLVTVINPTLMILAIGVIPIEVLVKNANFSLALLAQIAVGDWLKMIVVFDAAFSLSSAVLSSYVGIQGLHRQLARDHVMPAIFLSVNRWGGSNHFIIIGFCVVSCSLRLLVDDMSSLGGVCAVAFLSVLMLLCLSSLFLKYKRGRLRGILAIHPLFVLLAFFLVTAGLVGNVIRAPRNAMYFAIYFFIFLFVVSVTRLRVSLSRVLHDLIPSSCHWAKEKMGDIVASMRHCPVVYFAKYADINALNKAIQYIVDNEDTHMVKVVHMVGSSLPHTASLASLRKYGSERDVDKDREESVDFFLCVEDENELATMRELEKSCAIIDQLYPKLTIELLFVLAPFTPRVFYEFSTELDVPRELMFMGCRGDCFPNILEQFDGVRVINY